MYFLLAFCDWNVNHMRKVLITAIFVITLLAACVPSGEKAKAWEGIKLFHELFNKGEFPRIYDSFLLLNFAAAVLTFVCVYLLIRRREWSLALYAFLTIVTPLSSSTLQSVGRYTMVIFPIYIALASIGNSRRIDQVIRLIFIALLGLMTALFAAHFSIALRNLKACNAADGI